jgi:CRISPR/Cas system-associated exonuclease Cas4 (RecB family)
MIVNLVQNSDVNVYYENDLKVFNERAINTSQGDTLIPDRVVFKNNKATIIDYKTGSFDVKHEHQLNNYAVTLQDMGYDVDKKILVYLGGKIKIRELN